MGGNKIITDGIIYSIMVKISDDLTISSINKKLIWKKKEKRLEMHRNGNVLPYFFNGKKKSN